MFLAIRACAISLLVDFFGLFIEQVTSKMYLVNLASYTKSPNETTNVRQVFYKELNKSSSCNLSLAPNSLQSTD